MTDAVVIATASPADHPCALHKGHSPKVLRTQGHHIFPIELQSRVWPDVSRDVAASVKVPTLLWVCGTGHDNIHTLLDAMIKAGPTPPYGSRLVEWRAAAIAFSAFHSALRDPSVIPVVGVPHGN